MREKPWKEARRCNCLDAGRRRAPGVADLPGGAGRRHAPDRGATGPVQRSTGGLPAALAASSPSAAGASPSAAGVFTAGRRGLHRRAGRGLTAYAGLTAAWPARPPGRTRPSAARTVNVETPAWPSDLPGGVQPGDPRRQRARQLRRAPLGARRTGTSPATPPQASAWSHRQMVAGSTPNASATWPRGAARSRTSCTAASRRPASSPGISRRRRPARAPRPAGRPRQPARPPPGRSRPPRLAAGVERNLVEHTSHHPPSRQAGYLAGISSQTGREGRERHAVNADQPARITRPMISMIWMKAGAPSWKGILRPRESGYRVCMAGRPCQPLTAGLRG